MMKVVVVVDDWWGDDIGGEVDTGVRVEQVTGIIVRCVGLCRSSTKIYIDRRFS
jgi:hypothetical protein